MNTVSQESPPARGRSARNPWSWIPTLYFAQGLPYVMVMTVSVIMYKRLGISNTDIALYTSWLYLPWVIKPLWSPLVDMVRTKRFWIVTLQLAVGVSLALVAFVLPLPTFFAFSLAVFWLMAFASATHDIAADGYYMLALEQHQQAAFVGVRSTFYRVATIFGQGVLVVLAGYLESSTGNIPMSWAVTFGALSALFLGLFLYHAFVLPFPAADRSTRGESGFLADFVAVFKKFFARPGLAAIIGFLLFYRFAEAQLVKMVSPFLLDARADGGLGLGTSEVGFIYGVVGVAALLAGGILGGVAIARKGLRYWLWPMALIMHLPDLAFVYLSQAQPESRAIITAAVAMEQFGYGFGFTAYMLYMIMIADGPHKTAHYAICTGFMALGMMIPGMWSGALQEAIGYSAFFLWVMLSTIPGFLVVALAKVEPSFGKKKTE